MCGEAVGGTPGAGAHGLHFSFQAFVVDAPRLASTLWPLPITWRSSNLFRAGGPLGHVEELHERAERRAAERGAPSLPLFVHSSVLGVSKAPLEGLR